MEDYTKYRLYISKTDKWLLGKDRKWLNISGQIKDLFCCLLEHEGEPISLLDLGIESGIISVGKNNLPPNTQPVSKIIANLKEALTGSSTAKELIIDGYTLLTFSKLVKSDIRLSVENTTGIFFNVPGKRLINRPIEPEIISGLTSPELPKFYVAEDFTDSDKALLTQIEQGNKQHLVILNYSGNYSRILIEKAFEKGIEKVNLYVSTLEGACRIQNSDQERLIRECVSKMYSTFADQIASKALEFHFYNVAPSIHGWLLDDHFLCIGWLVSQPPLESMQLSPEEMTQLKKELYTERYPTQDHAVLFGHIIPRILVESSSPAFSALHKLFKTQTTLFDKYAALHKDDAEFKDMLPEKLTSDQSRLSSQTLPMHQRFKVFAKAQDAYEFLEKYIRDNDVLNATFLHFSARTVGDLLRKLLEKKCNIIFYKHDSDSPLIQESDFYKDRLQKEKEAIATLIADVSVNDKGNGHLAIQFYKAPATIRGVRIDDDVLAIGWYSWEHLFNADDTALADFQKEIINLRFQEDHGNIRCWGHDRPCIVVFKGHPYFKMLNKMFSHQIANFELYHAISEKIKDTLPSPPPADSA